jgi:hypothetical protein
MFNYSGLLVVVRVALVVAVVAELFQLQMHLL